MARSDRLFDLIGLIRDGRLHRAQDLADRLEVSLRTLYRDMATLQASGVPIEGERGVGYALRAPIAMAPVALTPEEAVALQFAASLLRGAADPGLRAAAESAARKVAQAGGPPVGPVAVHVQTSEAMRAAAVHLPTLSRAIAGREKLRVTYATPGEVPRSRTIWPLQLEFWGEVWTCGAWCEWRSAFRAFRLDRMSAPVPAGNYPADPTRDLTAYQRHAYARPEPGDAPLTCSASPPPASRR